MPLPPSLGQMTERVKIQSPPNPQANQNDLGEVPDYWLDIAEVWAKVESVGEIGIYTVVVRSRNDVNDKCRLLWRNLTLWVQDVQKEDQRNRLMTLTCSTAK